jgi:uncharacterized protein (TIGR02145 family)
MKKIIELLSAILFITCVFLHYQLVNAQSQDQDKLRDKDGNLYSVVKIGNQVWMAENLKTTKYNNGTSIPLVTENAEWSNLTTPAYCWYGNDEVNYKNTYGALYNWHAVNTGKLCPTGWHVPTDEEWTTLINFLGGTRLAGGKIREAGTEHWSSPNTGATNVTGFTALPGGNRFYDGTFNFLGFNGNWWSSTESSSTHAWNWSMTYNTSSIYRRQYYVRYGFAIRCIRD